MGSHGVTHQVESRVEPVSRARWLVKVDGHGEWICRTYLRPLRRKGGVAGPPRPRKTVADIERDMGLEPGELSRMVWLLEEADWR